MSSSVYRDVTEKELREIIEGSLNTDVASWEHLTGGMFNTTYLVDTADCGKVVLRVGPVNRHLLMPFENDLMESEKEVYRLCRARKIPVSEVLACDTSKTLLDRDFMIVRHIPSTAMSKCSDGLSEEDRVRIYRDIGTAVGGLHRLTGKRFGRVAEVTRGGGFDCWSACMLAELERWESVAVPTGLYTEVEHEDFRAVMKAAAPVLDEVKTPHLAHCDLWFGNILVSDNGRPEFAAIIDADRSMWGDEQIDFSSMGWMNNSPAFWEGYGKPLRADRNSEIRRTVYIMMWALFDSYVWLNEYNIPANAAATRKRALDSVRRLREEFGIG